MYYCVFEVVGKQPEASDLLNSNMMNGDNSSFTSLINHVGAGSSSQVLRGAELISFSTSSMVTGDQHPSVGVDLNWTSCYVVV